jgi:hypothetical protein
MYPTYQAAWARACETATGYVGQRVFASLFAAGQMLDLEAAAAYAMADEDPPPIQENAEALPGSH